jgi:TolB-like protein
MQPTEEDVRTQLERLLASETFAGSTRLRRFLSFIVERTLAGEGQHLKEYTVGIEVFDRGEGYDPRIDSIVRVEAGRLRSRLDEYYRRAGAGDAVIVRIPRGGYTPVFERRTTASTMASVSPAPGGVPSGSGRRGVWWLAVGSGAAAMVAVTLGQFARLESDAPPVRRSDTNLAATVAPAAQSALGVGAAVKAAPRAEPDVRRKAAHPVSPDHNRDARPDPVPGVRVAVLPLAQYSTDPAVGLLAARLTDGVMTELVRTGRVQVISRTSTLQFASGPRSLREVARALDANLIVEGTVHVDADRIRVQLRMVDPDLDRKFALHEFDGTAQGLDDLQRRIALAIVQQPQR